MKPSSVARINTSVIVSVFLPFRIKVVTGTLFVLGQDVVAESASAHQSYDVGARPAIAVSIRSEFYPYACNIF